MFIGYINSKWSMPRRLALIAAVFLIPSLVQLYLYADHTLQQIGVIDREIEGAKMAAAVWATMPTTTGSNLSSNDVGSYSDAAKSLGVQPALSAYENAKTTDDQVRKGLELLDRIASGSGMAIDSSPDSFYAQDIFIQRLSGIKQALAAVQQTLAASSGTEDGFRLAMDRAVLQRTMEKLSSSMSKLLEADVSGVSKNALGDASMLLLSKLDEIGSKIKAANYQRSALANDFQASLASANDLIAAMAARASDVFTGFAESHAGSKRASLYWTLGMLVAATVLALIMVTLLSRGISQRLSNLVRAMDELSRKDLSVAIPYLSDTNENGKIAAALARFKDAMVENKAMTDGAVEAAK